MDGIHDLGGMDGMGPVEREENESVFHEEWEGRVFAINLITGMSADKFRYAIERMDPAYYLDSVYYERWLVALEKLLTQSGHLEPAEMRDRIEAVGTAADFDEGLPERHDPDVAEATRVALEAVESMREESITPVFEEGDAVIVKNMHPEGHTRCPRYVRRAQGTVERVDGGFPLPDTDDRADGEVVEPVYHVRFDAAELWDDVAEDNAPVYVDLWESYLEEP